MAVCVDAIVLDRLVVPAAGAMPLPLRPSMVTVLEEPHPIVLVLCSSEAGPDETLGSPFPVECSTDGGLCPEVFVAAHDTRLADLRGGGESRCASLVVISTSSPLP